MPGETIILSVSNDRQRSRALASDLDARGANAVALTLSTRPESLLDDQKRARAAAHLLVLWPSDVDDEALRTLVEIASAAEKQGELLGIAFDNRSAPLGLGSAETIVIPKRSADRRIVLDALAEKLAGRIKIKRTLVGRIRHRASRLWIVAAGVAGAGFFTLTGLDLLNVQEQICSMPGPQQPWLSDFCGWGGFGDRPTREERLAWDRSVVHHPGECSPIEAHVRAFPDGKYLTQAVALLEMRHSRATGGYVAGEQVRLDFYGRISDDKGRASSGAARAAARERASQEASSKCANLQQAGMRVASVRPDIRPICEGNRCGYEGTVTCSLERPAEQEVCGRLR